MARRTSKAVARPAEPAVLPSLQPQAAQVSELPPGVVVQRIQDTQQLAMSVQRPRDERQVLADALQSLELAPQLASKKYYVIPFKNHVPGCTRGRGCRCPATEVVQPNIRAAEELANYWGNCRISARLEHSANELTITAVFTDLQRNVVWELPAVVPKVRQIGDRTIRVSPEDLEFRKQVAIETSKAIRQVVWHALPQWLVETYFQRCREIVASGQAQAGGQRRTPVPLATRVQKMLAKFAEYGVRPQQIEGYLGKPTADITGEDLARLIGVYNRLADGESTAADLFGEQQPAPATVAEPDETGTATGQPPAPEALF